VATLAEFAVNCLALTMTESNIRDMFDSVASFWANFGSKAFRLQQNGRCRTANFIKLIAAFKTAKGR